jgi:hypothetical protein
MIGIAGLIGFVSALISILGYSELTIKDLVPRFRPWIEINCPSYKIPSNLYIVDGRYSAPKGDYKVRIYIRPDDNTFRFWLQSPKMDYAYNKQWAELCCFGNPNRTDHHKIDPTFNVYAVLVEAFYADSLPGTKDFCPWIECTGELAFFKIIKESKGVLAISPACAINRGDIPCPEITVLSPTNNQLVKSPLELTWTPPCKMYVEIKNSGCKFFENYCVSGTKIDLFGNINAKYPSTYFQIILSEKKGFECQKTIWCRLAQ